MSFEPNSVDVQSTLEDLSAGLRLVVVAGRHLGAEMEVSLPLGRSLFIGSHLNCDLVISDEGVTPSHAVVFEEKGCLWVKCVPGGGESFVGGQIPLQNAVKLEQDIVLGFGPQACIKVQGSSLPDAGSVSSEVAAPALNTRKPASRLRAITALGCIAFSAVIAAISLGTDASASRLTAQAPVAPTALMAAVPGATKKTRAEIKPNSLESAARQVDRYLADPGVKVTARPPNRIEVAGAARSLATRTQLKKIQVALPDGVEIFGDLSYPEDKVIKSSAPLSEQPLANLAKKVLQVASSEKAPFIEVEGGARIFEGGRLNGFELLKITPGVIVARRDNQIETFKVE